MHATIPRLSLVLLAFMPACSGANFGSASATKPAQAPAPAAAAPGTQQTSGDQTAAPKTDSGNTGANPPKTDTSNNGGIAGVIGQIASTIQAIAPLPAASVPSGKKPCTNDYYVPATANPYLAGVASGSLTYDLSGGGGPNPTDSVQKDSPVLIAPVATTCIVAGAKLSFSVHGSISYASGIPPTDANGNLKMIVEHQLGAKNGKSNINAPINSLLGVFLAHGDPSAASAPTELNFSTQADRDYATLAPAVGQVFFVGNGMTSGGQYHEVVVPAGATRLYFAVMDVYQWNNNAGGLNGAVLIDN